MSQRHKRKEAKNDTGYSSEELYHILFEQAADGILISDPSGRYIEVNPCCCEMLGYTREEMLGFSYSDLVAPEEIQQTPLRLDELHAGKLGKSERSLRRKDGTYIPVEISARMLSDGLILGLLRDISDRKQAEAELLQLSRIPAENPNPILRVSNLGEILYANSASRELLEEMGTEVGEILPTEWKERISELAGSGSGKSVDVTCKGRIYSMAVASIPGTDYVNLYGSDVTEHRQAEMKIRASEKRYRSLFENMLDGFAYCKMIYENDQPRDFVYLDVNKNFEALTGLKNVVGKKVSEVIPGLQESNPQSLEIYGKVARTGMPESFETFIEPLELWLSISVYCPEKGYFVAVFDNITDRRKSEEALHQAELKYRNIFEHSLDGIFQSTPAGRFLTVNPALARMWGYESPEDLLSTVTNIARQIYAYPEQRNEFMRLMDENGEVQAFEFQAHRKDGGVIWVQESVHAVKDSAGKLLYYEGTVKDITEQKRIIEALRRSEERYRRTLNNMLEGCQIIDYDWRYIYINDTGARQGRRKPEEILMHSMLELYPGIEKTEMFAALQRCMEKRTPNRMENQFIYPDGDTGWFELSIEPVPEGLFILSVDITERKRAEAALKQSEMFLKEAQRIGRLGSWDWDAENDATTWSEEYYHIYGFDPSEKPPVYEEHLNGYTPESAARLDAAVKKALQTGEPYELDLEQARADGTSKWITARGEVKRDANGRITGLRGTAQDITERKQAERQLQDREARYRTLFENLPIPVFTKDLDGRYTSCNAEEAKYWAESPIGHTDSELLPPEIADSLRAADLRVMETEESLFGEEKFQAPDGLHYALVRKVPIYDGSGNVIGVLGASLDITERKEAEKKIKQQLERLTALSEIDRVITSSFDLSLTLNQLIRHVLRQLEVDAATILQANPITNTLEYVAGEGFLGHAIKKRKLRIGEDYAGKVALERHMIHIPNLATAEPPFNHANLTENENFVGYYGLPLIAKGQLKGVLEVFLRRLPDQDEEWLSYLASLAEQAAIAIDNAQLFNNLQQKNAELSLAYDATIEGWSYALDLRDKETEGHTQRVTDMTTKLCKKFSLSDREITYARWGALLHDIGKMGIPDAILQKPTTLTEEEWEIMKMHPVFARNMLERVIYLKSAIDIPHYHHEKWDGSGYPRGLKGEQIPLTARIFAIVDAWDALTSDRPYRPAWSRTKALEYIKSVTGTHFDPQVARVFLDSEELWND